MEAIINNYLTAAFLEPFLGWLALLSTLTFVISLLLIPFFVSRLPADCFLRLSKKKDREKHYSFWSLLLSILSNIIGLLLLFAGIIMLFLPGQGLLTILLGLLLLSFPGKQKLIDRLIRRPGIQRSLDWIRTKSRKPPFYWPQS